MERHMASITGALIAATIAMHPISAPLKNNDLYCTAAVIYYETRGENKTAQAAVAHVVHTRVRTKQKIVRTKVTACSVVRRDGQFPWANNRRKAVKGKVDREAWKRSVILAARVMNKQVSDPTRGATHFCHVTEVKANPWCRVAKHHITTGDLRFVSHRNQSALIY